MPTRQQMLLTFEKLKQKEKEIYTEFVKEHGAVSELSQEQLQQLDWLQLMGHAQTMDQLSIDKGVNQIGYTVGLSKMDMLSDPRFQAIASKYENQDNM